MAGKAKMENRGYGSGFFFFYAMSPPRDIAASYNHRN